MPLTTVSENRLRPLESRNFQTNNPTRRVSMRIALEGTNRAHRERQVEVSVKEMNALRLGNRAIDDTWRILDIGSANQRQHVLSTQGESYRRTLLTYQKTKGQDIATVARDAARYRAGNCYQMAAVSALLLATDPHQNQPVAMVANRNVDHAFVEVGDARERNRTIIVDAWPEFGRAMRKKEFQFADQYDVVQRYAPRADLRERESLLRGRKYSQRRVNEEFGRAAPALAQLDPGQLTTHLVKRQKMYEQRHTSYNLGAAYYATDSAGITTEADQTLSEEQFLRRMEGPLGVRTLQDGSPGLGRRIAMEVEASTPARVSGRARREARGEVEAREPHRHHRHVRVDERGRTEERRGRQPRGESTNSTRPRARSTSVFDAVRRLFGG
ncbi:hypothetical protein PMPD1_3861 [Paramixta manurensis]|uniref:Uncharacterized protein n=1 Tax=Paramixta manurensis TaxID=2740817 RepID=A0A6M8UPC0_9GAMM|nr:hypothetical protein PMPD1_3861 [Erwiniaceae bacterium PD-1]